MGQNLIERPRNKSEVMDMGAMQTVTLNGSAGAAVLSAAIASNFIRVTCTQPAFILFTIAGTVTSTTGHYLAANIPYCLPKTGLNTKVSVLGATVTAGVVYISELV